MHFPSARFALQKKSCSAAIEYESWIVRQQLVAAVIATRFAFDPLQSAIEYHWLKLSGTIKSSVGLATATITVGRSRRVNPMKLVELLERLQAHLAARSDYAVVAGPRPRSDGNTDDDSFHPIIAAFADDNAQEVILRTSETQLDDCPESDRMTLRDLVELLETQGEQRSAFDVETSSSGTEDEFRVDFPIAGTGWGDENRTFAFLW